MANAPSPGDIESLARQYWDAWGGLSGTGQTASPWAAMGVPPAGLGEPAALDWYARMQQLAAQFANGGSSADIGTAWRNLLGGTGGNPFASVLPGAAGLGAMGGAWPEQVRPLVEALLRPMRQQATDWLGQPGLGPGREHQQRLQALARAWQEWEEHHEAYASLLSSIGQDAFARFERLLVQHESPDKRLTTARALFDLWIDAAEEAWAELALSDEYRRAYGEMTNALMRLRLGLQREAEQFASLLGLPGRTEVDALARKVADLERALHAACRGAAKPSAQAAQQAKAAAPAAKPVRQRAPAKAVAKEPATAAVADTKPAAAKADKRKARAPGKVRKAATVAKKTTARRAVSETVASRASLKAPAKAAPKSAAQSKPKPAPKSQAAAKAPPNAQAVVAMEAAAATRQAVAKPAARKAAQQPKAVAARSPRPARSAAKRATGKAEGKHAAAPASRGKASAKPAGTAPATSKTAGKPARRAAAEAAPAAKVVSIKDWVSRNLAATSTGRRGGSR